MTWKTDDEILKARDAKKDARIAELERESAEKSRRIKEKGCPDCLGIGYAPAVLRDAVARAEKAEAKLIEVGELLGTNGCDCECDHHADEHDDDCERCLACRIDAVVGRLP